MVPFALFAYLSFNGIWRRLAGFGQRHDEQPQIKADIFPPGLEDFALARPGQQKQAEGKGFQAVDLFHFGLSHNGFVQHLGYA